MADESATSENLTVRLLQDMRKEIRQIRDEGRETRQLSLMLADQLRRVERRVNELPDQIETMLKSEIMGRLTHFETRLEQKTEEDHDRLLRELTSRFAPKETPGS